MIDIIFYVFAILTVVSAIMVISSRNPVHGVLFLIFCFFNLAGLFVLIGAEYVAMTLVVVYVGAVAVLFLFVVMMLNINVQRVKSGFLRYLPVGMVLMLAMIGIISYAYYLSHDVIAIEKGMILPTQIHNTKALGLLLYTEYFLAFQLCGLILFVAMIGAIVLTVRHAKTVRRQKISVQINRDKSETLDLVEVKSGEGIKL